MNVSSPVIIMNNNKHSTYHRLLVAAAECFAEKGFNATSVSDIARRAAVSQGSMYTYFSSKSELITAIVNEEKNTSVDKYVQAYDCSAFERVCQLVKSCINEVGYPVDHRLWVEIIAEASRNEEIRESFISSDIIMRDGIKHIIQKGIEDGEFSADVNHEEASIVLFALIDGLISRKAINPQFELERDMPGFVPLLRNILRKPTP